MSAQVQATMNPNVAQESIDVLLEHMIMLSAAVTQIQTGQGSMGRTLIDTLIVSIQGTAPVPKPRPVYSRNPIHLYSNSIIDYSSSMGAKRYRYATASLSPKDFDHTTVKFLEITTSLTKRSDKSGWGSRTGSITEVKVDLKTYDLFREYGQFTVKELTVHIKVYVDAEKKRSEQNSEVLVTCILSSVSPGNIAEIHAIYDDFKIGRMVYGELVFKGIMNKAIFNNKQATWYLQYQYNNLPSYMNTCDSDIAKFILEWCNAVVFLEAYAVVLTDKFKTIWRAFKLYKDAYFLEYMGRKQESREEENIPTPLITVDKLLKFAMDKYTDQSRINNHVWGSLSKREAEFLAPAAEVTTLKGNLKLYEKIVKKHKPSGDGGGGQATSASLRNKRQRA